MGHLEHCCFSSLLTCWMVAKVLLFSCFSEIKPGDGVKNQAERWARRLGFRIVSFREHIPGSYALTFFLFWECCGVPTVTEPLTGLITDEWWRCWHFLITELSFSLLKGQYASGQLNGYQLWEKAVVLTPKNGWVAIGTRSFEPSQFDNFAVVAKWVTCQIISEMWASSQNCFLI